MLKNLNPFAENENEMMIKEAKKAGAAAIGVGIATIVIKVGGRVVDVALDKIFGEKAEEAKA